MPWLRFSKVFRYTIDQEFDRYTLGHLEHVEFPRVTVSNADKSMIPSIAIEDWKVFASLQCGEWGALFVDD